VDGSAIGLELGTVGLAVLVGGFDLVSSRRGKSSALLSLGAAAGLGLLLIGSFSLPAGGSLTAAWVQDELALFAKRVFLCAGLLAAVALHPYGRRQGWQERTADSLLLLLLSVVGAMALVSARELLALFVAFELVSVPLYALAAIGKSRPESPEGALKIFLFGSASSATFVLGMGLLFAATGTTFWMEFSSGALAPVAGAGFSLLLVAFGFKIAMFPFYMWVPDTYEAAPTPVVAFLSLAPKAAGFVALFRLEFEVFSRWAPQVSQAMGLLAAATMIAGNLLALPQQNLKRLLAYSGVAHVGYLMLALAAGSRFGAGTALFYFVAYLFSNMGAFLAVAGIEAAGAQPTLAGVRGLGRRAPAAAAALLVFLLSLGGIPFVLGFWGKLLVLLAAGRAGLWWLVFVGAAVAVMALYYYLNVARSMFMAEAEGERLRLPWAILAAVLVSALLVASGGLLPQLVLGPALAACGP
jgi:NADH-quinone oxidoreductase subunit N